VGVLGGPEWGCCVATHFWVKGETFTATDAWYSFYTHSPWRLVHIAYRSIVGRLLAQLASANNNWAFFFTQIEVVRSFIESLTITMTMTTTPDAIPVIDLSDDSPKNCKRLIEAAIKSGCLFLKNHLLEEEEIDKLFDISSQFFRLPTEVKNQYPITTKNAGYVAPFVEDLQEDGTGAGDDKEAFNMCRINLSTFYPDQNLPQVFAENMPFISFCMRKHYVMLHMICRMLAQGLEVKDSRGFLDPYFFASAHALDHPSHSTMRFVHYSKHDESYENVNLTGAHTDYGSITLILQRPQNGLQIFDGSKWQSVEVPLDENGKQMLVVNISDILSFWTDGLLKSVLHRVRTTSERDSIVFFCHPADDVLLVPVNSELVKSYNGKCFSLNKNGLPLTALDHLRLRLNEGYKRKD
jgi:isopenicillin N synthase-like dioxygenase